MERNGRSRKNRASVPSSKSLAKKLNYLTKLDAVSSLVEYALLRKYWVSFTNDIPDRDITGLFHQEDQYITIYLRNISGDFLNVANVVYTLAHEIRHIQHVEFGLYRSYYKTDGEYRPECFLTALAAERDCDRFAAKWLASHYSRRKDSILIEDYPVEAIDINYQPFHLRAKTLGVAS